MSGFGKWLILAGAVLALAGAIIMIFPKFPIGRLPGDIYIRRGNFSFYFPVTTGLLLSLVLTLVFRLFGRK